MHLPPPSKSYFQFKGLKVAFELEILKTKALAYGKVARTLIVETKGSVPREAGTAMLSWETGQLGTIGGGALEFSASKDAFTGDYLKTIALGPNLGQCCGGSITLVNEVFDLNRLNSIEPKNFYSRKIAGNRDKPLAIKCVEAEIRNGKNPFHDLLYSTGWLVEAIETHRTPVWVYGAGHVGRALVQTLSPLPNLKVTWLDTSKKRFPNDLPDQADILYADNITSLIQYAPNNAIHIVLTYSHEMDLEICHKILETGFNTLGLIGSKTKWARFQRRLLALGHSRQQINRINCPIGDPSFGKHPQAIAISLAAELLQQTEQKKIKALETR